MEKRVEQISRGIEDLLYDSHPEYSVSSNSYAYYAPGQDGDLSYDSDLSYEDVFIDSSPHSSPKVVKTAHYKLKMSTSSTPPTSPLVLKHKTADYHARPHSAEPAVFESGSGAEVLPYSEEHKNSPKVKGFSSSELSDQSKESHALSRRASMLVGKLSSLKSTFSRHKSRSTKEQAYDV